MLLSATQMVTHARKCSFALPWQICLRTVVHTFKSAIKNTKPGFVPASPTYPQQFLWKVSTFINPTIHGDKPLHCGFISHVVVVQAGIQHNNGKWKHVTCIWNQIWKMVYLPMCCVYKPVKLVYSSSWLIKEKKQSKNPGHCT